MLQQHLAQVDLQTANTTSTAAAAAAGGAGKDVVGQSSSSSSRTSRSFKSGARSHQQARSTLTNKLLHHQSKLEQALTSSAGAPGKAPAADGSQGLAAGIESGGGAALMSNFAALATGNRQLTTTASLTTDSGQQLNW